METTTAMKQKCGRCSVTLPMSEYKIRRNGNYNKLCNQCLANMRAWSAKDKAKKAKAKLINDLKNKEVVVL